MQQPLTEPYLTTLHRAIADGSLSGAMLQAMLVGPSPVSATGRRRTRDLHDVALPLPAGETTVP